MGWFYGVVNFFFSFVIILIQSDKMLYLFYKPERKITLDTKNRKVPRIMLSLLRSIRFEYSHNSFVMVMFAGIIYAREYREYWEIVTFSNRKELESGNERGVTMKNRKVTWFSNHASLSNNTRRLLNARVKVIERHAK